MSKKKNKKKNNGSLLTHIDNTLDKTYNSIIEEVQDLQYQLNMADQKARKKAKKKIKENPNYFDTSIERLEARKEVVKKIEGDNLLDRIQSLFKDMVPIVLVISRLIASLILAILSLDIVKTHINPNTLLKMQKIYQLTTSVR